MTEIVMALMWDKNALVEARFTHFGRAEGGMKNGKSKPDYGRSAENCEFNQVGSK